MANRVSSKKANRFFQVIAATGSCVNSMKLKGKKLSSKDKARLKACIAKKLRMEAK